MEIQTKLNLLLLLACISTVLLIYYYLALKVVQYNIRVLQDLVEKRNHEEEDEEGECDH